MREKKTIVINTSPIIALSAGIGNLAFLSDLYEKIIVPSEVYAELTVKDEFLHRNVVIKENAVFQVQSSPVKIDAFLRSSLDIGESAVIQTAIDNRIDTVCIDEIAGRRIAKLYELKLTGSLGICLKAIREGFLEMPILTIIENMQTNGIYISRSLVADIVNRKF